MNEEPQMTHDVPLNYSTTDGRAWAAEYFNLISERPDLFGDIDTLAGRFETTIEIGRRQATQSSN